MTDTANTFEKENTMPDIFGSELNSDLDSSMQDNFEDNVFFMHDVQTDFPDTPWCLIEPEYASGDTNPEWRMTEGGHVEFRNLDGDLIGSNGANSFWIDAESLLRIADEFRAGKPTES